MRARLLALLLLLPALAGCFGSDEASQGQGNLNSAQVDRDTGGIEGIVTDPAVQPIQGANVTLVELNRSATTAEDGSYAISRVEPGSYTLRVEAERFLPQEQEVDVSVGSVEQVDVILAHERFREPFQQAIEMKGFVECGIGWKQEVVPAPSSLLRDSALAACAVPNLLLPGGNATNDRFLHRFQLEPPLTEVVYELAWDEGTTPATAPPLRTIMEVQGFINAGNLSRIMDVRGHSPIRVDLTKADWDGLEQNFTDKCNGENGTEQDDDWCGMNFRSTGWDMVLRVFATGDCFSTPAAGCGVVQQEFTHFVSAFYNQPAPEGYGLTDGS